MQLSVKNKIFKPDIVGVFQIFQVLRYAAFFVIGIALAKSGMALKEIGVYETLMFLSGAVSFFWVGGLLTKLLSAYAGYKNNEPVLFNVFVLLCIISAGTFVVLQLLQSHVLYSLNIEGNTFYFKIFIRAGL